MILMTRGAERWERVADQSAALTCAGGGCAKLARCYRDGMADRVIDFDDHLGDPADDWRTAISTTPSPRLPERRRRGERHGREASDAGARRATHRAIPSTRDVENRAKRASARYTGSASRPTRRHPPSRRTTPRTTTLWPRTPPNHPPPRERRRSPPLSQLSTPLPLVSPPPRRVPSAPPPPLGFPPATAVRARDSSRRAERHLHRHRAHHPAREQQPSDQLERHAAARAARPAARGVIAAPTKIITAGPNIALRRVEAKISSGIRISAASTYDAMTASGSSGMSNAATASRVFAVASAAARRDRRPTACGARPPPRTERRR